MRDFKEMQHASRLFLDTFHGRQTAYANASLFHDIRAFRAMMYASASAFTSPPARTSHADGFITSHRYRQSGFAIALLCATFHYTEHRRKEYHSARPRASPHAWRRHRLPATTALRFMTEACRPLGWRRDAASAQ